MGMYGKTREVPDEPLPMLVPGPGLYNLAQFGFNLSETSMNFSYDGKAQMSC